MTKKEIILINMPPSRNYTYENSGCIYPATGIMVIGTILKNKGFSVSIIDGALDPGYEETVLGKISSETAFVGFSAMTSQIVMGYELAKKIKERMPCLLVVFGGIHPTLFPEQTVQNPYIDIAVINEGTKTVMEILDYVEGRLGLEEIRGISFRDSKGNARINSPQSMDDILELPHFNFELLDTKRYLEAASVYERELAPGSGEKIRLMPVLTALGCCFKCTFCVNVILKRPYRARPAESIIKEIKRLQSFYGANAFLFLDEDFCINKKRLKEFLQSVKDGGFKFSARIWARVSYFKNESFKCMIPEMEKAGIKSIAMGAESGSQNMLDYMCKDIKTDDIVCAAEELRSVNITPRFSFMVGLAGEKKEETISTYKLCGELLRINPRTDIAGPFAFRYYPGSPIFSRMVKDYNIKLPQSIEDWNGSLNNDGSLILDARRWTWPGFSRYSEAMYTYIDNYMYTLNKPVHRNSLLVKILKKILLWRLARGEYFYFVDYYLFKGYSKTRTLLSRLKSGFKR